MSETLKFRLDDGTEFDAYIEDDEATEIMQAGPTRIAAVESDVEAHGVSSDLRVVVYGPDDDVEGHSMTLRLPHAGAARDLQKKLLAAGAAGVIVVGAATTTVLVADNLGSGSAAQEAPAVPAAPWWVNPAVRDGGGADAGTPSIVTPAAERAALPTTASFAAHEAAIHDTTVSPQLASAPPPTQKIRSINQHDRVR